MTSLATEYVKTDDGTRFIPATQRPDGTWRKPRKVKDGYVPQEEVPLYESKGKMFQNNKPQYPVGLSPDLIAAAEARKAGNNPIPGLVIQPQDAKTAKKKKKKKAGQGEDLSEAMSRTSLSEALLSTNHITSSEAASQDNEWKTFTAKGKSKRGNPVPEAPPKSKANAVGISPQTSKPAQKAAPKPAPAPVAQTPAKTDTVSDPAKRLKNLRKKLREIETVEQKAASGVKLEKDQLDKIARKAEILKEIEDLE
ncbi:partner of Y14 and mago [Thrips palmi]|uniref:Partner of Y14 and mago n=1 Tax=Thrips palmi TaxID=161013 RepID=A0A6P8Z1W5_THRPL|nr:partner of Y14 and mago [Thrips palmi]XP_034243631.1 partner of Y14 and mago [Thrips palmi]XP_034243632.1 partner of Y14 and mago [Thrips palmi]XP_034243633.1 partner of Y14 and mago [Thrips palmi]